MKNYVAIAPKEGEIADYLTNGKEYPITRFDENADGTRIDFGKIGFGFYIIDDYGVERSCLENESAHLNGLNWTIKEVKP